MYHTVRCTGQYQLLGDYSKSFYMHQNSWHVEMWHALRRTKLGRVVSSPAHQYTYIHARICTHTYSHSKHFCWFHMWIPMTGDAAGNNFLRISSLWLLQYSKCWMIESKLLKNILSPASGRWWRHTMPNQVSTVHPRTFVFSFRRKHYEFKSTCLAKHVVFMDKYTAINNP